MKNKKVICINGNKENYYDKVIFIMKESYIKEKNIKDIDLVKEAENIIEIYKNNYKKIKKNDIKNIKITTKDDIKQIVIKNSNKFDIFLNIAMLFFCVFMSIIFLKYK